MQTSRSSADNNGGRRQRRVLSDGVLTVRVQPVAVVRDLKRDLAASQRLASQTVMSRNDLLLAERSGAGLFRHI